jgi:hypothetical protein
VPKIPEGGKKTSKNKFSGTRKLRQKKRTNGQPVSFVSHTMAFSAHTDPEQIKEHFESPEEVDKKVRSGSIPSLNDSTILRQKFWQNGFVTLSIV